METILVYPKNPEKLEALKAFLKALKIDFEKSPGIILILLQKLKGVMRISKQAALSK